MQLSKKNKRNSLILAGCLAFFILGLCFVLTGILVQVNPQVQHFAGLFNHDSLMNLIDALIPAIR